MPVADGAIRVGYGIVEIDRDDSVHGRHCLQVSDYRSEESATDM